MYLEVDLAPPRRVDLAGAEQVVMELRQVAPDVAQTHLAAAIVALERGDLRSAEREADAALALDKRLERARAVLRKVDAARRERSNPSQPPSARDPSLP